MDVRLSPVALPEAVEAGAAKDGSSADRSLALAEFLASSDYSKLPADSAS